MFSERTIYLVVIASLIVVLLLVRSCNTPPKPIDKPVTITKVDTIWLKKKDSIVYKPSKSVMIPADTQAILRKHLTKVDTANILKDYFAKYAYRDSIKLDSLGYIYVSDTITENKIASRKVVKDYKIPIVIDSVKTILPPIYKNQVYVGFNIMGNKTNPVSYFGPSVILKTKTDKMYNINVGISTGGVTLGGGMAWKIKLK
jgi:hypothetical protein